MSTSEFSLTKFSSTDLEAFLNYQFGDKDSKLALIKDDSDGIGYLKILKRKKKSDRNQNQEPAIKIIMSLKKIVDYIGKHQSGWYQSLDCSKRKVFQAQFACLSRCIKKYNSHFFNRNIQHLQPYSWKLFIHVSFEIPNIAVSSVPIQIMNFDRKTTYKDISTEFNFLFNKIVTLTVSHCKQFDDKNCGYGSHQFQACVREVFDLSNFFKTYFPKSLDKPYMDENEEGSDHTLNINLKEIQVYLIQNKVRARHKELVGDRIFKTGHQEFIDVIN